MRTLVVARHAETELNLTAVLNGDPALDVPLSDAGRGQARRLGEETGPVDLVVHSSFRRARETASLAWPRTPMLELPDLNEFRYGRYEGTRWDDGFADWTRSAGPLDECPGGGDSRASAVARYVRGFRAVASRPEKRVALVAHGAHVACLLLARQGRPPERVLPRVPFAAGLELAAEELAAAVELLDAWAAAPAW